MKVLILTEGGANIGFGHIGRCLALFEAFKEYKVTPELIVNIEPHLQDYIGYIKYFGFNWMEEGPRLQDMLRATDVAIIDSYQAGLDCYRKITPLAKVPVYIDDNNRLAYPSGVLVNPNIYAESLYTRRDDITYLIGSNYTLLRREFWSVCEKEANKELNCIMVTFGGDDSRNMTPRVLNLLTQSFPKLHKKIIIGRSFTNIAQIEALKDQNTEFIYYPDASQMKSTMLEADIAIALGGQTLYELARVGVPSIAVAVADNQLNNIRELRKAGFIEYAGWWQEQGIEANIIRGVELLKDASIRRKRYAVGRNLVNGKGSHLVAEYLVNCVTGKRTGI